MNDASVIRELLKDFGERGLDLADPKHATQVQRELESHEGTAGQTPLATSS